MSILPLLRETRRLAEEAVRRRVGLRRRAPARMQELTCMRNQIDSAAGPNNLLVCRLESRDCVENVFLEYYRKLGIQHFLFVSMQGKGVDLALTQPDCSVWATEGEPVDNGEGAFWTNALLNLYGLGRLAVVVGPRDYLVYPYQDTRNLSDVMQYLGDDRKETVHALIVEGYCGDANTSIDMNIGNLFCAGIYFDRDGYIQSSAPSLRTRIQGGPSLRTQSREHPEYAPDRDCIPVILWERLSGYRRGNQELFPSYLNRAHKAGEVSLTAIVLRLPETHLRGDASFFMPGLSVPCDGWKRFVDLGLCSPGNWV